MERFMRTTLLLVVTLFPVAGLAGAQQAAPQLPAAGAAIETAPVVIDGVSLFPVRGIQSYPAKERARLIEKRIRQVAADRAINADSIVEKETDLYTEILAGSLRILSVVDADAQLEGIQRQVLARVFREKIRAAVENYRRDRSPRSLLRKGLYALLSTGAFLLVLILLLKLFRKLAAVLEQRYRVRVETLRIQNLEIVQAQRIWSTIIGMVGAVRGVLVAVLSYFYLELVLSLFPWTREVALRLLDYVVGPLTSMGRAFLAFIPDLIVIVLIVAITRYGLKLLRLVFLSIEFGKIKVAGFDPDWARPTYKIMRFLVLVFAAVVIYPYVPGSQSAAFKGISIFVGIMFSLGSSSAISNVIAGYSLTYRRAFKVGDRVRIGEVTGDVTEMRMQVTHVRTIKNEEVTIPNSTILGTPVVNFSSLVREDGLILHTTVTIGYDTPWRQVHAMLLLAAERTEGLLADPKPFVLQTGLNDFYVSYELNCYTDQPRKMARSYSDLHQNIQDVFNEFGVQIMSPHYLGDPAKEKIVPKAQWHAPPAKPEEPAK